MSDELLSADDMRRIRVEWRMEAEDRIRAATPIFRRMARGEAHDALIKDLMRALHSLKGTASMVGFRDVADFVHHMEDYCDMFRGQNPLPFSHISVELLTKAMNKLLEMVERTDADHDPALESFAVLNELNDFPAPLEFSNLRRRLSSPR